MIDFNFYLQKASSFFSSTIKNMQFIHICRCSSSPIHVVSQFNPDSQLRDEVRWDEDHITQTKFEERMGCQLKQGHLQVSCGKWQQTKKKTGVYTGCKQFP